jgi:hypothetical protein
MTDTGHFITYAKCTFGNWYRMNDSSVKQVHVDEVFGAQAATLIYSKCDDTTYNQVALWLAQEEALEKEKAAPKTTASASRKRKTAEDEDDQETPNTSQKRSRTEDESPKPVENILTVEPEAHKETAPASQKRKIVDEDEEEDQYVDSPPSKRKIRNERK